MFPAYFQRLYFTVSLIKNDNDTLTHAAGDRKSRTNSTRNLPKDGSLCTIGRCLLNDQKRSGCGGLTFLDVPPTGWIRLHNGQRIIDDVSAYEAIIIDRS
jgi:hypothetical protein